MNSFPSSCWAGTVISPRRAPEASLTTFFCACGLSLIWEEALVGWMPEAMFPLGLYPEKKVEAASECQQEFWRKSVCLSFSLCCSVGVSRVVWEMMRKCELSRREWGWVGSLLSLKGFSVPLEENVQIGQLYICIYICICICICIHTHTKGKRISSD